jgi:hypothetical protein
MSARRALGAALAAAVFAVAELASSSAPPTLAAAAPSVEAMVVGTGGAILSRARTVTAAAATVRIGARSCSVAAGTPLAALLALRRQGGPGFALHDYGRCGAASRDSGQLFVYSLGGERNSGQSGWEYKVSEVSGSTGAADPSGPSGNGRPLRSGDRVLWFWCQPSGGGCQHTLALAPSTRTVSRGSALSVTVYGYDNEGRGYAVSRATVSIGAHSAFSGSGGHATVIAPSTPGRYQLAASRSDLVPSFPETIVVR